MIALLRARRSFAVALWWGLAGSACGDAGPRELAPATAAVSVGNNFFRSDRNGTENTAVDTVRVGGTVTWTWIQGNGLHSVESLGNPSFTSSDEQSAQGSHHEVTFTEHGIYEYICSIHGEAMSGRVVVE